MKQWFNKMFMAPFTVACDRGPYRTPFNEQEVLIHATGLFNARWVAKRWVRRHPNGQARILVGHHTWEETTYG
jgi:hypothetical protein